MRFSTANVLSALLALSPFALAQNTTQTHNVLVGADGLTFTPNQVTAAPGDIVAFEFHPKNHTLTQSTFANPCTAMANGATSGFQPVAANATQFPVFSFMVNDVTPLWFFCQQTGHCQQGMVFALNVNASSPNTFAAFQAKATGGAAPASGSASAGVPAASGMPTMSVAAGASASATGSAAASSSTAKSGSGRLAVGGVASVMLSAVGVAAGLLL